MNNKNALDNLISPEQQQKDRIAERRARRIQVMLIVILIVILAAWGWGVAQTLNEPKINQVEISDVKIIGENMLCPGDDLILEYSFYASGAEKLVEGATVWRDTPPKTIIYSEERSFLIDDTFDEIVTLAWNIPVTYTNPATDNDEILPSGEYRRIFSVSSVDRPSVFAIESIKFTIKDSCSGKIDNTLETQLP